MEYMLPDSFLCVYTYLQSVQANCLFVLSRSASVSMGCWSPRQWEALAEIGGPEAGKGLLLPPMASPPQFQNPPGSEGPPGDHQVQLLEYDPDSVGLSILSSLFVPLAE